MALDSKLKTHVHLTLTTTFTVGQDVRNQTAMDEFRLLAKLNDGEMTMDGVRRVHVEGRREWRGEAHCSG